MATTFVGRRAELAQLTRLLRRARLVTLCGVAGVGKTRLARRVLEHAREIPVDLTVMVDLEPLDDPDALPGAVARGLGVGSCGDRTAGQGAAAEQVAAMAARLGGRRALLVLDTCDRVVDAAARLATALLRAVPGLRVLATGRQSLGVPGEHVHLVRPLPGCDAVALLRDRLGDPPGLDTEAARELCGLLDGVPLAIELAARALPGRPIRDYIAALGDGWEPAGAAPVAAADLPERHRSIRAALGWSHGLCTPRERLLWARLSVFPGDFDLAAAEHVCAGGPLPAWAVLDAIGGLVDKSVVLRADLPGAARYRLLRGVRAFGAEWLDRLGERDAVRRRHDDYRKWRIGRGER
ncbi:MAG: AAA family ATPase [Actinomycetes bacterium]|jgi:predicted ATPase|nr:MAG: hypothetical protein DIU60_02680 [Actinomycetota bacterium]